MLLMQHVIPVEHLRNYRKLMKGKFLIGYYSAGTNLSIFGIKKMCHTECPPVLTCYILLVGVVSTCRITVSTASANISLVAFAVHCMCDEQHIARWLLIQRGL